MVMRFIISPSLGSHLNQLCAACQRHADRHLGSFVARYQTAQAGDVSLLDDLDPAGDLVARERLDQLRVIRTDVALNPVYHLIVSLAPYGSRTRM